MKKLIHAAVGTAGLMFLALAAGCAAEPDTADAEEVSDAPAALTAEQACFLGVWTAAASPCECPAPGEAGRTPECDSRDCRQIEVAAFNENRQVIVGAIRMSYAVGIFSAVEGRPQEGAWKTDGAVLFIDFGEKTYSAPVSCSGDAMRVGKTSAARADDVLAASVMNAWAQERWLAAPLQ